MRIVKYLKCLLGKHHRSRSRLYRDGNVARSYCRNCNVAMIQKDGLWRAMGKVKMADGKA